ncbi:NlpC/P60 family protein [Promicromonospora sp. NPDC057488]|uniref:NlpC/P60 family protein n=1 Tax=Promicromonospora sp. NPDC057488 TaxID=3346147 RepID=UPI00366DD6D0
MTTDVRADGGATFRIGGSILAALALLASILVVGAPPASAWPAKIGLGDELNTNERLVSPNGQYNLLMQENGNLVLRNASGTILWHPEMDGSGSVKAEITDAGNVVLRQADGDVTWASGTTKWAASATTLEVTDNGNVLLSNTDRDHLWRVGVDTGIHGVERMIEFAKEQLGEDYVWGAEGPNSWDCSGLTSQAVRAAGTDIGNHMSSETQYNTYKNFSTNNSPLRRGDLVFYGAGSSVTHVAIYLGSGKVIHAPGPEGSASGVVQIGSLDSVANRKAEFARMFI